MDRVFTIQHALLYHTRINLNSSFFFLFTVSGKEGVQFYTKMKVVAQKWKDLPARKLPLPVPQILETQRRQSPPELQPPTSGSDAPNLGVLPITPLASERYIASQNAPSRLERALINQDISLAMPSASKEHNLDVHRTSLSTPQTSERVHIPPKFQSGDSLSLKSPRTGSDLFPNRTYVPTASLKTKSTTSTSLRMDLSTDQDSEISVPTSQRKDILSLMSSGNDNMGSNLHRTDINTRPTFESIYAPAASKIADSAGLPNSGGVYMLPPQACIALMPTRATTVLHPASDREYLHTSGRNDMVQSHMTSFMPLTSERMYMPSTFQRNSELPTSSRTSGQRMFDPETVFMGEYSGHGSQSTSQRR